MRKIWTAFILLFLYMGFVELPPIVAANSLIVDEMRAQQKELVAENEFLQFYMNKNTAEFAIINKRTNDIWYSNPVDYDQDPIATLDNKEKLRAQLSIRYLNRRVQEGTLNSYTDSVKEDQIEIEEIDNGVRVTYTLGKEVSGTLIPKKITFERMENFLSKMTEDQRKEVLRLYMEDKENEVYTLRTRAASFRQEEAAVWFAEVGYTVEEYFHDIEEHGIEEEAGAFFIVPVEYRIDGETFIASIDAAGIINGETTTMTDIKLLEFFGAGSHEEEGYIFVSDASGALIHFNNGKVTATTYVAKVYGIDETLNYNVESQINKDLSIRMPVFGISKGDKALLGVITDGISHASIIGDVAGKVNSYNVGHAEFNIIPNGRSALQSMTGSGTLQLYQREPYDGKYEVTYFFLDKEHADYSGMARKYQSYLVEQGYLTKKEQKEDLPLYIELLGGINIRKTFLGFPYYGIEVLTTYEQAKNIIDKVKNRGAHNLKVIMNGWFNRGVHHDYPGKVKEIKALNRNGFNRKAFIEYTQQEDIDLYFDVDFQYVYRDGYFDGISRNRDVARYFDNTVAKLKNSDLAIADATFRDSVLNPDKYILSPNLLLESAQSFYEKDKERSSLKLALRSLTNFLSSDFSTRNEVDREESRQYQIDTFTFFQEKGVDLLGRNSNDYALPYLIDIIDVPLQSNEYTIFDETVPFYQMVLKGFIEYAGRPLNLADDYQTELLKAIEMGAGLYFVWIHEENHKLKNTEYTNYYSVNFDTWYERAMEMYTTINEQLKKTQNQKIIKHQKIQEGVYRTSYENGIHVYVNYNNEDVTIPNSGVIVKAKDFIVVEEVGQ